MAAASRGNYKPMYSWWWDSHLSPKNSIWLQENRTRVDVKVKDMKKLLEEDGDSFGKKAEMYFKKRPELKTMVEELYGAYRALAERYDHATGVLRQAHRTMAEAFPNQVLLDDSPSDSDPRTPEMNYLEESDSLMRRKGSKHFDELFGSGEGQTKFGEGRARKGLNFQDAVEKEQNNGSHDRVEKDDSEISSLKKVLVTLEAEKEASLGQYRESLERISKLELEVSNEQESSSKLNDRARKAEDEVKVLKESLEKLETECKTSLLQYQQSLDKMSNLESEISRVENDGVKLSERASKAETEVEDLKQELSRVEADKEAALVRHQQCLEKISNLEKKLSQAEEDARKYNEKADKAESELITLREALKKLKEENEAEALKYQECMEKIASLELTINYSKEEAERLQLEIDNGIAKIKGAEEKCLSVERSNQTLQSELDSLMLKMGQQNQELTEKQRELGRLWNGMQEEHSRFVEAETAFQTLQHLHLKSEEELKLLGAEIQNRDQTLKNLESHNQSLDDQVQKVMEENMALNEFKLSSALSIKNLQDEISRLRVTIGNIEAEVELRVNERNALQQEIYCLKEEINDLNKKNGAMIKQVEAVGYGPDCFESSVKELQAENKTLKANFEEERNEKEGLLQKLTVMKELLDRNIFLENSISDMNVEIEELREKVTLLEGSCQFLMEEKGTLVAEKDILTSHLQTTTKDLEKLTNKSMFLENSLSDANAELEEFRTKAKSLQDLCLLLDKEKSGLITDRENVQTELETSQKLLKDVKERFAELEGRHSVLVGEKESSLRDIESLQSSLDSKKQEHANFAELSKTRLADLELQNRFLQEEGQDWKNQYEEELNRAINSHMEIFILQKCLQDMEEKSLALQLERQELLEVSIQSDKSISELERGNFEKDLLAKTSAETIAMLRSGLQDMDNSLLDLCDKKYRLTIEKFVIEEQLEQLRLEAGSIMAERNTLDLELRTQNEVLRKVSEMNEELRSEVAKGEIKEESLISEIENLSRKLHNLEEEHQNLQAENFKALDGNCLLAKEVQHLKEENFYMMSELTYQTQLSLIFREIISEKCDELKDLGDNLYKLRFMNGELEENVRNLEGKLGGFQIENLELEKSLEKSLKGLHEVEERQVLMEKEKTELHDMFDQLKAKNNEFMEIQEGQGKKILKLSDDNDCLAKETLFLREMKHNLEGEVQNLQEEIEQKKIRNETLSDELEKNKSEVQLWETQAAEFLSELQISAVREVLFAEKIHEFAEAFESLQEKCDSKEKEVEIHAERRSSLEEEIKRLNIELGSYIPAIKSLNDSITLLEEHTIKSKMADKQEAKDSDLEKCDPSESCAEKYDDRISSLQSGSYELQGLLQRLLAIELAVIEAEKLSTKDKLNAKDETKYEDALPRENGDRSRPATPQQIESGARNEVSTKDIVLDENSECSSYGISRRETSEVDDHMLADYHLLEACKKPRSKHSSTESLVEKELGVDKLEISSRFSEPDPEVKKMKIIEGLEADAAKLINLQTTVQDLKRKVEGKEKNRKGKVSEYDSLKGKLIEAEEAITRLFDINQKLRKNVQDDTLSGDQNSFSGPDELGRIKSRRISEQARKGSEKIGRLQLEMDKVQFILLKLEDEIQMRDRARAVDRKQRVLLRDYLYGRTKDRPESKRGMFCACLNPPTGED